jgi:thiol:disulfide interchange protein/DsbC/DsbD-like thiol-disulfide interchange protein
MEFLVSFRGARAPATPGPAARRRGLGGLAARAFAAALLGLAVLGTAPDSSAQQARTGTQRVDAVDAELVAERTAVQPGTRIELGLRLRHDPDWHTYWRNPGDSGLATQIAPGGPEGARFDAIRWPAPKRMWVGPLANYGYEGEVLLPFSATVPPNLSGPVARFEAHAQWLVCREVCIPGEARVALELPVAAAGAEPPRSAHAALFEASARRTPDAAAPLKASLHRDGQRLALVFATPPGVAAIERAEFFPHEEGVVSAPAPQPLLRTEGGWRIDLALAEAGPTPATLTGVLVADARPVAIEARAADGPAPAGTPVSVAAEPAGQSRPGGGLLGAIGASGRPAAGGWTTGAATGSASDPGAAAGGGAAGLALALLFGAIGGVLLNLMPCVFPVVGLKVLGFANAAGDARGAGVAMRRGALAFSAGVLVSFWVLGGLLLALRAAGESVGWGFQLQSPGFVAAMALLFVAVGLSFSGVFEIGMGLTRLGGAGGSSAAGSFGAGVLAVLVATPCTAPFMGSALGFTLAQPAAFTMAVFTAIGVGMALPYLVLGLVPGWVHRLPRPGRWMQTLRQALAFPMYATAAWLAWVLVQQAGADAVLRLLLAAVLVGLAAWAWGRFGSVPATRPALAWTVVLASAALGAWLLAPLSDARPDAPLASTGTDSAGITWEPWSERRVDEALAQGRPVFVDFTAAWCVSCQANKKLVLERDTVAAEVARRGVVMLRADWTQRDPAITAELARHGRNGVPLYLVYRERGRAPQVLPELLTTGIVLAALR